MYTSNNALSVLDKLLTNSIGFDELFQTMARANPNFPPYNLVETDDGHQIEIALAGYDKEDIEVSQDEYILTVKSALKESFVEDEAPVYKHQGIAKRKFESKFALSHGTEVTDASFENGMLVITLVQNKKDSIKQIEIT